MKNIYEIPEMKIILLAAESIVTRGGEAGGDDDMTGEWEEE